MTPQSSSRVGSVMALRPRRDRHLLDDLGLGRLPHRSLVDLDGDVGDPLARVGERDAPGRARRIVAEVLLIEVDRPELAPHVGGLVGRDLARRATFAVGASLAGVGVADLDELVHALPVGSALVHLVADAHRPAGDALHTADLGRANTGLALHGSAGRPIGVAGSEGVPQAVAAGGIAAASRRVPARGAPDPPTPVELMFGSPWPSRRMRARGGRDDGEVKERAHPSDHIKNSGRRGAREARGVIRRITPR